MAKSFEFRLTHHLLSSRARTLALLKAATTKAVARAQPTNPARQGSVKPITLHHSNPRHRC